ncbi:macrolide transporter subunit MacA [Vibrio palustris]|uniref:Macrolide export protein MacA n=1 Tax=Vibrio palustris TaxID=1918946 RepID=A0A1R4B2N2_9VIBR|nr:macrolide transporter subunit MacA [Vibrio palustris]SJL83168.1 Macrolide export protein MacA [Vibrio palustris]
MPTFLKRKIVFIPLILLIIAGGAYILMAPEPEKPQYTTQPVTRGNIEKTVLATGMLHASTMVEVGAQASGQINRLAVNLGDDIKQGQLVAQIDSMTQQNTLKEAQASLNSLQAQLRAKQAQIRQAQAEYQRQQAMLKDQASSKADYESAEANLAIFKAEAEQLDAKIQQATISLDTAKVDLGYTTISAPMDGTVVYKAVSEGQTVNANQTTPTIIELANLNKMTVKVEISEADIIHVKPGMPVHFTIMGDPEHQYVAKLRAIEPGPTIMTGDDSNLSAGDSDAIYYYGLFDIANPNHILRIGMTAQVSIVLQDANNVLMVPSQAVSSTTDDTGKNHYTVPVLEQGKMVYRDVTIGVNNKVNTEIESGLKQGDEVIVGMPGGDNFADKIGRGPF